MEKTSKESYTEQVHILTQNNINGMGRLFGGQLMEWIDMVAGVVARRHSNRNITTALVDTLEFSALAFANDLVVLRGKVVYVGTYFDGCLRKIVRRTS
jgi:Acyl-CoA hydrolase